MNNTIGKAKPVVRQAPVNDPLQGLPMMAQVLLEQIAKASQSERPEIHGRLERYVSDFSQKDIPSASAKALNVALKGFGLPPVAVPQSANVAAWTTMVARELSVTKSYSSHMGHDVDMSASHIDKRRRIISDIANRVGSLGPSLTDTELKDAAVILTLALRNTP